MSILSKFVTSISLPAINFPTIHLPSTVMEQLNSTTLSLVLIPITGVLLYYVFVKDDSETQAKQRGIKYVDCDNMFMIMIKGKRFELIKHEIFKKEGPIFGRNMLGKFTIFLAEPELIGQVLSKEFASFPNRREFLIPDPAFTENLVFTPVDKWKRLRQIVSPTFSAGKIRQMKPCIDETLKTLIKNLEPHVGEIINAKQYFGAFTMDTIVQIAFGVKIDSLVDKENPVILNAKKMFSMDMSLKNLFNLTTIFFFPTIAKLFGLRFNGDQADFFMQFSKKIIDQKRAELVEKKGFSKKASSFIELMLEVEDEENKANEQAQIGASKKNVTKHMTTEEITSMCVLFFLAGYDTTATAITMTAYNLALHPEVQEKLYDEIESVLEKLKQESSDSEVDPFSLIHLKNLSNFEYLTACLNETLRIYPPGLFTERAAIRDAHIETDDGKYRIDVKEGDIIHIPTYSIHRDAEQFPEPELYKPERFMDKPQHHHKYSFIPFGAGPRNCVAKALAYMEAKLALIHVVRNYRLSPCDKTKIPPEFYNQGNLMVPKDVLLMIEKR